MASKCCCDVRCNHRRRNQWSGPPGMGVFLTRTGCSSPSGTSCRPKLKQTTTGNLPLRPQHQPDLNPMASTEGGVVQKTAGYSKCSFKSLYCAISLPRSLEVWLHGISGISWYRSIQYHSSCHEKWMLGDAKCCQPAPDMITKKPAVARA